MSYINKIPKIQSIFVFLLSVLLGSGRPFGYAYVLLRMLICFNLDFSYLFLYMRLEVCVCVCACARCTHVHTNFDIKTDFLLFWVTFTAF